jgi:oligoribonuclease
MANDGRLVWIDCEMTGLDLTTDALVEIAVLVTDSDLTILGNGVDVVIRPPDAALEGMQPIVKEMHEVSGLIKEIPHGVTLSEAEDQVMQYVREFVPEPRKAPLAGSSVYTDRGFISRDLPTLDAHLHYRLVDVSTIKELSRRWYPRAYYNAPEKHGGHRALADIKDSIAELRYYREAVFVPDPGPDGATSKQIASRYGSEPPSADDSAPESSSGPGAE